MKKYLMLWPNTSTVRHTNYHITMFGEVADYIENIFTDEFEYIDLDVLNFDQGKFVKHIINYDLKAVAMFVSNGNFSSAIKLAELLKQIYPNIKILAYGHLVPQLPEIFAKYDFDAIHTSGDPETAIESFFKYANNDISLTRLYGVELKMGDRFIKAEQGIELDPQYWGFARLDKLPVDKYNEFKEANRIVINISRGCPFGCNHCLVHITQGLKERRRPIEKIKEYLETVKDKYTHIKLWAANFTLDKQYVYDFCNMKNEYFPNMTFECATRVNLLDDEELINFMARSGCTQITIGVESIQQEILDNIHKNYNAEDLNNVIDRIQNAGMKVKACIMLNIPGQTKNALVQTLNYLTGKNVSIRATIYTPYQDMTSDLNVGKIETYNRRVFYTNSDEITFRQYLQLEYDILNYRKILEV